MGKNKKYQFEERKEELTRIEEKPGEMKEENPSVFRFKGRGTYLIGGLLIVFSKGIFETEDPNLARVLTEHGFERA